MLRMSKLSDYSTVIMARIAREPQRFYRSADVAAEVGIALPTVSKLLKILAREHLLVSQRGAKGGYALARPAGDISLAQIIDAVEGPLGLTECSAMAGLCAQEEACAVRGNWQRINRVIREALEGVTLADFAQPVYQPVNLGAIRSRHQSALAP